MQQLEGIKFSNLSGFGKLCLHRLMGNDPIGAKAAWPTSFIIFRLGKCFVCFALLILCMLRFSRWRDWFQMRRGGAKTPSQITALIRVGWQSDCVCACECARVFSPLTCLQILQELQVRVNRLKAVRVHHRGVSYPIIHSHKDSWPPQKKKE